MRDTSILHVNLTAIDRNMALLREIVGPDCGICPIVKADAYGLGAPRLGPRLVAGGAAMLAVYTAEQAASLAAAAVGVPILVLMPVHAIERTDELYGMLVRGKLHLTVHDPDHLEVLARLAEQFGTALPLHVEVDTGMGRGGAAVADVPAMLRRIADHHLLRLAGLFTHFSNADTDQSRTDEQLERFDEVCRRSAELIPPECTIHVANTYATLRHRRYHRSVVRIGLAWAGYGLEEIESGEIVVRGEALHGALCWSSSLVSVKWIEAGSTVGYGARWTAPRRSLIGLVPVGYADGYPMGLAATDDNPRAASVGVGSSVAGEELLGYAPVIGAVNMDQVSIDLTDLAEGTRGAITVGTRVELVSPERAAPNALPKLAREAGTIPHEMLTRINPRIRRVYEVEAASTPESPRRSVIVAG